MELKKEYKVNNRGVYTVKLTLIEDGEPAFGFYNKYTANDKDGRPAVGFNQIASVYDIDDLSNKKYYEEEGIDIEIEYIDDIHFTDKQENIIPVGLVNFINDANPTSVNLNRGTYAFKDISIHIGGTENLKKVAKTINNIEKAIKINYDIKELKDLFEKIEC
jgi:maltose-binding protein MalE